MKTKLILVSTLLTLSLSLFACTSKQVPLEITCDHFTEDQHFTWEVEVNAGDLVAVTLCSNPTTGFQWTELAQISDQNVIEQVDHKYEPAEEKNIVGGAGKEVWTFKALREGTTEVSMEYSRPGEGGDKGHWTFVAIVTVEWRNTEEANMNLRPTKSIK